LGDAAEQGMNSVAAPALGSPATKSAKNQIKTVDAV
jgi:hypothetical protein